MAAPAARSRRGPEAEAALIAPAPEAGRGARGRGRGRGGGEQRGEGGRREARDTLVRGSRWGGLPQRPLTLAPHTDPSRRALPLAPHRTPSHRPLSPASHSDPSRRPLTPAPHTGPSHPHNPGSRTFHTAWSPRPPRPEERQCWGLFVAQARVSAGGRVRYRLGPSGLVSPLGE